MTFDEIDAWSDEEVEERARLMNALAHPVRVRIVARLLSNQHCVGGIVECLGLPQPLVSRHLAVLRDVGVVAVERKGRKREYRVVHPCVASLLHCMHESWKAVPQSPQAQSLKP
jgi:DNA-binding transcriptional ArsR family regulator